MADAPIRSSPPLLVEPSAIVVRTPNWLGDLMMCTGFLRALLARFPDVPVDLIVRQGFEVLPLPQRGRVLPYDRREGPGAFGGRLRARGYSHFFVLPPSFSAAWMAWRSAVPWRVGFRGQGRGKLLRPALRDDAAPRSRHLALEYLHLLSLWGVPAETPPAPHLPVDEAWCAAHRPGELAGPAPYAVLAPGAEYGPAKQWPLAGYGALARGLSAAGVRVVVVGLDKDAAAAAEILAGVPGGMNLCGRTNLAALVATLAGTALLVSNDSGAMHVAAALGRPQVALFGSTSPAWTGPLNARARVFYRGLSCSPCYARTCPLGHTNCLHQIDAGEVQEAALELLQPSSAAKTGD
ncbi:MAG: lipopolysaccharide heptosyltransferase II [Candidatus Lambdaproteobacteria bacterium]|nr:lipopolysaccharide heptosyltransferase II [Candidatus Lambdaproteobacteria bacterium]